MKPGTRVRALPDDDGVPRVRCPFGTATEAIAPDGYVAVYWDDGVRTLIHRSHVETLHGGARPGAGRPALPEGQRRDARVVVRTTQAERDGWTAMAKAAGLTLSEWVRRRCVGS